MNVDVPLCRLHVLFQYGFGRRELLAIWQLFVAVRCWGVGGVGVWFWLAGVGGARRSRPVGLGPEFRSPRSPQTLADLP